MDTTVAVTNVAPRRTFRWIASAAWGVAIVVGALYLKLARPEDRHPWLAVLMGSEPFHVFAHLVLYGALALLLRATLGVRPVIVFFTVIAVGVAQETAQVFHVRGFGGAELFDLCVDALAATMALGAWHLRARRNQT
jgi:hypothetical protein